MILSFLFVAAALAASPCDGSKIGYWKNPDGSRGGSVASTAKVSAGVIIGSEAQVCGEAVVSGKTHIFGRAKISGKAKIHNATICQASQINGFDVVDSDYYCQTEDPEPAHPGEAGKKTLLGIDSDRDGVRDDLEIWINQKFSNTPEQNKENQRMAYKAIAKNSVQQMKFKSNIEVVQNLQREKRGPLKSCVKFYELQNKKINDTSVLRLLLKTDQEFEANLMDTKERFNTYMDLQKHFSGWGPPPEEYDKLEGAKSGCIKK